MNSDSDDSTVAETAPIIPTGKTVLAGPHLTAEQFARGSDPAVVEHLASCRLCRRLADVSRSQPLPDELITESAFRWPAEPMAEGGMALVFRGDDRRLERKVILKVPRQDDDLPEGMNEMFQARLETEARVLARLQHPAIVTIYEVGRTTTGSPFCVLEEVEGVPLREKLDELADRERETGKHETQARLGLVASLVSVAEGLAYAHDRGVVHRDLNPNNIMMGRRGEATIIDWGIAKDTGHSAESLRMNILSNSRAGSAQTISAGTPPFVCFEQAQGFPAAPGYDVYSFGMALYECVSGTLPYLYKPGNTDEQRHRELLRFLEWAERGPVAPPASDSDPELSGIIARAITRDEEQRFTADELLRALNQYLTGDLVFSHRYSRTGRLSRWVSKHRGATVAMGLVVAASVAGTMVWLSVREHEVEHAAERRQLVSQATSAEAEAETTRLAAELASAEAVAALARAEAAEKSGQNAEVLKAAAEAKRLAAETAAKSAADAAATAKLQATSANATAVSAAAAAAASEAARVRAEEERARAVVASETARAAQVTAEEARARAVADAAAAAAKAQTATADRDAAQRDRELAVKAQEAAVAARDEAVRVSEAAAAAQREAERKVASLEARVRELEAAGAAPPTSTPPPAEPDARPRRRR